MNVFHTYSILILFLLNKCKNKKYKFIRNTNTAPENVRESRKICEFDIPWDSYSRSRSERIGARELLITLDDNCHRRRESRQRDGNMYI